MEPLPCDHPEVISLLEQLQGMFYQIGKISALEGYVAVRHFQNELYSRGWNSRLAPDGVTVELFPVQGE